MLPGGQRLPNPSLRHCLSKIEFKKEKHIIQIPYDLNNIAHTLPLNMIHSIWLHMSCHTDSKQLFLAECLQFHLQLPRGL